MQGDEFTWRRDYWMLFIIGWDVSIPYSEELEEINSTFDFDFDFFLTIDFFFLWRQCMTIYDTVESNEVTKLGFLTFSFFLCFFFFFLFFWILWVHHVRIFELMMVWNALICIGLCWSEAASIDLDLINDVNWSCPDISLFINFCWF